MLIRLWFKACFVFFFFLFTMQVILHDRALSEHTAQH